MFLLHVTPLVCWLWRQRLQQPNSTDQARLSGSVAGAPRLLALAIDKPLIFVAASVGFGNKTEIGGQPWVMVLAPAAALHRARYKVEHAPQMVGLGGRLVGADPRDPRETQRHAGFVARR